MPELIPRRSRRLKGRDYAEEGGYFITLVTSGRISLFGDVKDQEVRLSNMGQVVQDEWLRTELIRTGVSLDLFVVMPNHFHAILWITEGPNTGDPVGAHSLAHGRTTMPIRKPRSLGSIVSGFKAATTSQINRLRGTAGVQVWQTNYWDRVIRNDYELDRIRDYILLNPTTWEEDSLNRPDTGPPHRS